MALIASSSWSHAFLTKKTHWLYPDLESDRARLAELREGRHACWRDLGRNQIEEAGQKAKIVDWVESYIFNSGKCFARFQ